MGEDHGEAPLIEAGNMHVREDIASEHRPAMFHLISGRGDVQLTG